MPLKVIAFNCTLTPSPKKSSTDKLLREVMAEFKSHDATGEIIRALDYNIKPGVTKDEGRGDDWPKLRGKLLAADIVVIGTPIWLGQPSSVCKRVLERIDAFLDEKDDQKRMPTYGKVAVVAVVGNEDGAHHCAAEIHEGLNETGFTIPASAVTYWVGEALGEKDYKDFKRSPKVTTDMTKVVVSNAVHLAAMLKHRNYPGI